MLRGGNFTTRTPAMPSVLAASTAVLRANLLLAPSSASSSVRAAEMCIGSCNAGLLQLRTVGSCRILRVARGTSRGVANAPLTPGGKPRATLSRWVLNG